MPDERLEGSLTGMQGKAEETFFSFSPTDKRFFMWIMYRRCEAIRFPHKALKTVFFEKTNFVYFIPVKLCLSFSPIQLKIGSNDVSVSVAVCW